MKKTILFFLFVTALSFGGFAQSLSVESYDTVVYMNSNNGGDYSAHVTIKNESGINLNVKAKRQFFGANWCAFDSAYFCWDFCYGNDVNRSVGTVAIPAGTSSSAFSGHVYASYSGVSCMDSIRYTFYDEMDASDSVSVVVKYGSTPDFSIDENKTLISQIFPNPADRFVTITLEKNAKAGTTVEVFNLLGAKVHSQNVSGNRLDINTANLHNGIYLVTIKENGKAVETKKLVVKH